MASFQISPALLAPAAGYFNRALNQNTSMPIPLRSINADQLAALLEIEESHFIDLKSIDIAPSSLTKTAAAFCNTSGGELFIGIKEIEGEDGKQRTWSGFADQEAACHTAGDGVGHTAKPALQVAEGARREG